MAGRIQRGLANARAVAARRHHVVAREQLLHLGLSRHAVAHMVERGHLHPLFRGVYAVGRAQVTWRGWWTAAVLVTSVICTVIDIAPGLSRDELEGAVNQADKLDLIDPEELRAALTPQPGRAGIAKVRTTLDRRTFTITDSELERLLLPIARRAGMPKPLTQVDVNGHRVDFYFPELGVLVETDGLRYHRTPAQQARDRLRDQTHIAAGLIPLRFTRAQVKFEPAHVEEVLAAVTVRRDR